MLWTDPADDIVMRKVIVSRDGYYSTWPPDRDPPTGWADAGMTDTRRKCLAFVQGKWNETLGPSDGAHPEWDTAVYQVVVNQEEAYSIWPAEREPPMGWSPAGMRGIKQQCLNYIKEVWTDMRPLSLREKMLQAISLAAHRD